MAFMKISRYGESAMATALQSDPALSIGEIDPCHVNI
jgi:hypothetical protein